METYVHQGNEWYNVSGNSYIQADKRGSRLPAIGTVRVIDNKLCYLSEICCSRNCQGTWSPIKDINDAL